MTGHSETVEYAQILKRYTSDSDYPFIYFRPEQFKTGYYEEVRMHLIDTVNIYYRM